MRILKQEIYFPILILIHFGFWAIDLYFYQGSFTETHSDTLLFGELINIPWSNVHRILGEVLSSWVVTVFAANFLMATRAKWVEKIFGGLDKMYLIHRRSGVIAIVLLIAHFIVVPRDLDNFSIGKPLGFFAMVLILLGVLISAAPALKKKIPYHRWINIHKLMGLFYVLAVVHAATVHSLIKEFPITRTYVLLMSLIGVGSWFYRAFLYGLFNKQLNYTISAVKNLGNGITEIKLKTSEEKLKFKAGQFAFFKFPVLSKKEQHPFTISSHPLDDELRISVKGLGDYTNEIDKLQVGDEAKVEGPFGLFSSRYAKEKEQIWIAGGIGITPFLSLSKDIYTNRVKLFWTVKNESEAVYSNELDKLSEDKPCIDFTTWASEDKGYLTVDNLGVENYDDKAYLLCGPQILKESITSQLLEKGVSIDDIYDEEFAFR